MNTKIVDKNRILYETYEMYDLDGTFLCFCNKRKARYYIHKTKTAHWIDNQGQEIVVPKFDDFVTEYNGEKLTRFRLKFKSNATKENHNDLYYKQALENRCVCCGTTEHLTKHHVIPYMYRKTLHLKFKGNSHHDVLPLCYFCHQKYELIADVFKNELNKEYQVPETILVGMKTEMETRNEKIFKARELIKRAFDFDDDFYLPIERITDLAKVAAQKPIVLNPFTDDEVEKYQSLESNVTVGEYVVTRASKMKRIINDARKTHQNLRRKHKAETFEEYLNYLIHKGFNDELKMIEENLYIFVFRWRKHFIDNAKPKFMPDHWDIFKRY